jgi:predicted transcriptional regulator of viral defense system/predicted nucleotidyltransferase
MLPIGGLTRASREKLSKVLRQSKGAISPADASRALNVEQAEAARLLSNWSARGWLSRVRRGLYVAVSLESSTADLPLNDAWVVAERLFAPCYIGGWSAATHWGLTEQLFRSTLVFTTRRPRSRRVEARGTVFVVRTVDERAMFGLKTTWRGKAKVDVSDPTRTVLDLLDTPALGGGIRTVVDILMSYFRSTYRDPKLLIRYADRLGNKAVFKRLGFLATVIAPDEVKLIAECRKRLSAGNAKLDSQLPAERLVTAWRLWVSGFEQGAARTGAAGATLGRGGAMTKNRPKILGLLAERRQEIAVRFGVKRFALFGSAARDELDTTSDVDVLVEFEGPATFAAFMDLKFYLEDLLGRPVDLVTDKALRKELRPYVEKELIRVA